MRDTTQCNELLVVQMFKVVPSEVIAERPKRKKKQPRANQAYADLRIENGNNDAYKVDRNNQRK